MSDTYWQDEEEDDLDTWQVPENVLDVSYRLTGSAIAVDHAWELLGEICRLAPWFAESNSVALHRIHVAESGNGWQRPEHGEELLHLSRRTRLTLRLPAGFLKNAESLRGETLRLSSGAIELGKMLVKPLVKTPVIFSRYVDFGENEDEEAFLAAVNRELSHQRIRCRKMLCGRLQSAATPEGSLTTRSLMLADLDVRDAVRLQETGIGQYRKLGCGLFLAHKGIDAVGERQK